MTSKDPTSAAYKAFVDASAGAMGALFAAIFLYPLDVVKTRRQADVDSSKNGVIEDTNGGAIRLRKQKVNNLLVAVWLIYRQEGIEGLFAGLSSKIVHTVSSNFAYFYWYSFLKTVVEKYSSLPTSTGVSLIMASIAGALNMFMTLPLELINTRAQIQSNDDESNGCNTNSKTQEPQRRNMIDIAKEIYAENGLMSFWKGFFPSLVLVSNPSIHYTIFDKLKLHVQNFKMAATNTKRLSSLTALEMFVLAAISKAVATIITYPVIRAKVLIQAQTKQGDGQQKNMHGHHQIEMGSSMGQVLKRIVELEGPSGYFKGCSAQLFNTVLKSALLVMVKEQITKHTMRVLYALHRNSGQKTIEAAKS